ncbi:MAG: repair protein radA protein [candidate division TM6 bacterium GW2011_GWE2_41_16]|nr:MAG: repair protein radA protein [candidate division TM6 bacterium GW2011_GWE2_41_16]
MAKADALIFSCSECGYKTGKWYGCCPACKQWDSFTEEKAPLSIKRSSSRKNAAPTIMRRLSEIDSHEQERIFSGITEWDRVLGGGIMPASFTILTGDPGIGKSTLLMHVANKIAENYNVFYFSTEESLEQLKLRASRLDCISDKLLFSDQAQFGTIMATVDQHRPDVVIIDSIQNCVLEDSPSLPGTIGQLRELALYFMRLAKDKHVALILTGHITKEGAMAGPKMMEHMVDTVLYLSGDDQWQNRMLRTIKNRFGPTGELGFFEMGSAGLSELKNINEYLLSDTVCTPGSVLVSHMEGSRPLLLEVQALVVASKFSTPQRVISGVDYNQVVLIAAILEKHLKIRFSSYDIFFKVSGGFKIKGSNLDLGIAIALLSSFFQKAFDKKTVAVGEISLAGLVKPASFGEQLIKEAVKFGIQHILVASKQASSSAHCRSCSTVHDILSVFD